MKLPPIPKNPLRGSAIKDFCRVCMGVGSVLIYADRDEWEPCEYCHGFGCVVAGREWEARAAAVNTPSEVTRAILDVSPRLDAAGLPRFALDITARHWWAVCELEVRRDDAASVEVLAAAGFEEARPREGVGARPHMRRMAWRGMLQ